MFTAEDARKQVETEPNKLDALIEEAVREANYHGHTSASIRVYIEDAYVHTIREELEKRGFSAINVPDIILKGDVYFSW